MKAYLIVYGDSDEYEIDSVFIDKAEAEAYVAENNQIPYDMYDKFRIQEIELNPPVRKKWLVEVHGYINKNKEIQDLEIERIDREGLEQLKDFTGETVDLYPGKLYGMEDVIFFDGMIDVTSYKDKKPRKCEEYIKNIVLEKFNRGDF